MTHNITSQNLKISSWITLCSAQCGTEDMHDKRFNGRKHLED